MRLARNLIDRTEYGPGEVTTAVEVRVVLNRFETWVLDSACSVRNWWSEQVIWRLGRLNCRLFRRHNLTCRGRRDHGGRGGGIIDRGRWNGWREQHSVTSFGGNLVRRLTSDDDPQINPQVTLRVWHRLCFLEQLLQLDLRRADKGWMLRI